MLRSAIDAKFHDLVGECGELALNVVVEMVSGAGSPQADSVSRDERHSIEQGKDTFACGFASN